EFGCNPAAGLVIAPNGDFYGTTSEGPYFHGQTGGSVFKISPNGTLTTLYRFCSQAAPQCTDGINPSGLVLAGDGNFYGTTQFGGAGILGFNGSGTVFKITPSGTLTTLYSFCPILPCTDGAEPYASEGLTQAADGNFYGTTILGGAHNSGTVFKITPHGALSVLYTFCSKQTSNGDCTDGSDPATGLIQAPGGDFYGTTGAGGRISGTVFTITPTGALTTLHTFCPDNIESCPAYPGPLAQATNGDFYGTTTSGGSGAGGTIFRLSMGLGPFVEPQTTLGHAGSAVNILGTDLTGATSVSFNGAAAVFEVFSSSLIGAIVPDSATSGKVEVVTPSGTLFSNVPFWVLP
ncbi:MAG: choice-of-anchor tandem repeat GloVer-containing protein, partial [Terriglobia bacterium]